MKAGRYNLIIFDWDGTLMDSAAKIVYCFERAYQDTGVAYPGDRAIRQIIGLGLAEAVAALLPETGAMTRAAVGDLYRQYFLGLEVDEMQLFPGVRERLESLAAQGYVLAIATGKSRRGLDRVLAHTALGGLFAVTRCADEALSKPHPRMLEDILERTGLQPSQAVMIGDTTYDLIMARTAGMDGVAVSYGAHARDDLLAQAPAVCCDSFEDVYAWLCQP